MEMETLHENTTTLKNADVLNHSIRDLLPKLYAIRNALAPINARLPIEILCEIFLCLSQEDLCTVTNVCHHWKDVALRYPWLWSSIDIHETTSLEDFNLLLLRSQQALLLVRGPEWYYRFSPTPHLEEIFSQVYRIRELQISVPAECWSELLAVLYNAPVLEALCISREQGTGCEPLLISEGAPLPMPRLRRLQLRNVDSSVACSFIRSSLTELKLEAVFSARSVAFWISVLGDLPNLQCLGLNEVRFTETAGFDSIHIPVAHFSRLRTLNLKDTSTQFSWDAFIAFLQHVIFPASAAISIESVVPSSWPGAKRYNPLHNAISAKAQDNTYEPAMPYLSCGVFDDMQKRDTYSLWKTEVATDRIHSADKLLPEPDVRVTWMRQLIGWPRCRYQTGCSFFQSFPLSHLRTLYIGIYLLWESWWHCCRELVALRQLSLMYYFDPDILLSVVANASQRAVVILPRLEELVLSRIRPESCLKRAEVLIDVRSMLRYFKTQEVPLKRFYICEGPHLEPQRRETFVREIVDEGLLEVFEWGTECSIKTCAACCGGESWDKYGSTDAAMR